MIFPVVIEKFFLAVILNLFKLITENFSKKHLGQLLIMFPKKLSNKISKEIVKRTFKAITDRSSGEVFVKFFQVLLEKYLKKL